MKTSFIAIACRAGENTRAGEWPVVVDGPQDQKGFVLKYMMPSIAQWITTPKQYHDVPTEASLRFAMKSQDQSPLRNTRKSCRGSREATKPQQAANRKSPEAPATVSEVEEVGHSHVQI